MHRETETIMEEIKDEQKKEDVKEEQQKINWKKELFDWVVIFVVALILAICITRFIIIKTEIISGSMISTLNVDDRVIGNRTAYWFKEPARGDIVFFAFPDDEEKTYVKRIIGLPGETVEGIDGTVYINGEAIAEPYINGTDKSDRKTFGPYVVPEGCYFMLGDNRTISVDSRYWTTQFVTKEKIYGKAWLRYYPKLGTVKSASYE